MYCTAVYLYMSETKSSLLSYWYEFENAKTNSFLVVSSCMCGILVCPFRIFYSQPCILLSIGLSKYNSQISKTSLFNTFVYAQKTHTTQTERIPRLSWFRFFDSSCSFQRDYCCSWFSSSCNTASPCCFRCTSYCVSHGSGYSVFPKFFSTCQRTGSWIAPNMLG